MVLTSIVPKFAVRFAVLNKATVLMFATNLSDFFFVEFLLGDEIIAAPVLNKGQVKRDIYLPEGKWKDGNDQSTIYTVPKSGKTLKDYPAPLKVLPYFIKV